MNQIELEDFRRGLDVAKNTYKLDRLHMNGKSLIMDFISLRIALQNIEQATLIVDNPDRLRMKVRGLAANALREYAL
jgi:hypothetical protein